MRNYTNVRFDKELAKQLRILAVQCEKPLYEIVNGLMREAIANQSIVERVTKQEQV